MTQVKPSQPTIGKRVETNVIARSVGEDKEDDCNGASLTICFRISSAGYSPSREAQKQRDGTRLYGAQYTRIVGRWGGVRGR